MSADDARALAVGRAVLGLISLLVPPAPVADDLIPLDQAAALVGTSRRALKDAARRGELRLLGRERTRVVRRSELLAWIDMRKTAPVAGPQDADIDARVSKLARRGGKAA